VKLSEETLLKIIEAYSQGASYNEAARIAGIGTRTLWSWIAASRDGSDPELMVEMFGTRVTLERGLVMARRAVALEARSRLEKRALLGHDQVVTFQGAVCYRADIRCVGWSEAERVAFGFRADGLEEDDQGRVIPLTVHVEPPEKLVLHFLAVHFPDEYVPQSTQNINVNGKTQGVTDTSKQATGPLAIPPRPPMPVLEVLPDIVVEEDLSDILGPDLDEPVEPVERPAVTVPKGTAEPIGQPAQSSEKVEQSPPNLSPALAALLNRRAAP
jgi:transposase-like protein